MSKKITLNSMLREFAESRELAESTDPKMHQIVREADARQYKYDLENQARKEEEREHRRRLREEARQDKENASLSREWICCPGFI